MSGGDDDRMLPGLLAIVVLIACILCIMLLCLIGQMCEKHKTRLTDPPCKERVFSKVIHPDEEVCLAFRVEMGAITK